MQCETAHPDEVQLYLDGGIGYSWLCDAISRHEDADSSSGVVRRQLSAYVEPELLVTARILDFGCGTGGSSLSMARAFPRCQVVGVELNAGPLELARKLAASRNVCNVSFVQSSAGDSLFADPGLFDVIMLSAVYEHLKPPERLAVLPLLWSTLRESGVMLFNQTPHSWYPYEHHSAGLWLTNYLPDRLTHWLVRRYAKMNLSVNRSADWQDHLRGGIRGGSEREILKIIRAAGGVPRVLQPLSPQYKDRAAYWLAATSQRFAALKGIIGMTYRLTDAAFQTVPSVNLDVAIKKIR